METPRVTDLERARRYIIDGSATRSKRPDAFPSGVGGFAEHSEGPYLFTSDGRKLLDWEGALGATPLGASHPRINEAIKRQIEKGAIFSFPHVLEGHVAEQLCAVIPCAEVVKTVMTGSEACSAAASIARAATGRDVILCDDIGYHGWHDTFRVLAQTHSGVPDGLGAFIRSFVYGSEPETFDWSNVAAVMLEPARLNKPPEGWLRQLVDVAHTHGALVIFDEMIMAGRHRLAGGQEFFSVVPDLGAFGKAFGAGLPFGFVAGSRDIMQYSWVISGTFSGSALSLAACEAMLQVYRDEDVIATLWANGQAVIHAIETAARRYRVGVKVVGYPPHFTLRFAENHKHNMSVFCQRMAACDVLWHPAVTNASAAMGPSEIRRTQQAIENSLSDIATEYPLSGETYQDSVRTAS